MSPGVRDLLLAYRWPLAVVISSLVMAAAVAGFAVVVVRLLSRPIPIAIEGGLQVDRLVLPPTVTIKATTALPVTVTDPVPVLTARPLAIRPVSLPSLTKQVGHHEKNVNQCNSGRRVAHGDGRRPTPL